MYPATSLAQRYDHRVQHGVKDGHKANGVSAAPRNGQRSRMQTITARIALKIRDPAERHEGDGGVPTAK
jgi:hypothetical protein